MLESASERANEVLPARTRGGGGRHARNQQRKPARRV
jgi:hypothetical protein